MPSDLETYLAAAKKSVKDQEKYPCQYAQAKATANHVPTLLKMLRSLDKASHARTEQSRILLNEDVDRIARDAMEAK